MPNLKAESESAREDVVERMVHGALDAFAAQAPNVADLLSASMTLTVRAVNAVLDGSKANPVAYEHNRENIENAIVKIWERVRSTRTIQ